MFPWNNAGTFGYGAAAVTDNYEWHGGVGEQGHQSNGFQLAHANHPSHTVNIPSDPEPNRFISSQFYSPTNAWNAQRGYTPIVQHSQTTPGYISLSNPTTLQSHADPSTALNRFASCTNVQSLRPAIDRHRLDRSLSVGANSLTEHHIAAVKKEPGSRRYRCKLCPTDFAGRQDLQAHNIHHDATIKKDFKCTECSKSFSTNNYLIQHSRTHSQERPFGPCEHCGKKFLQLTHLQQHLRTHTGERPYSCDAPGCTKTFAQLSNLRNHSRIHEEEKAYKCNSCYKSFETDRLLYEHIQMHKRSKHHRVHVCPYCGKSYALATYLVKHLDDKHPNYKDSALPRTSLQGATAPTSSAAMFQGPSDWPCGDIVKQESTTAGCCMSNQHDGNSEVHGNLAGSVQSNTGLFDQQMFVSQPWQQSNQLAHPWNHGYAQGAMEAQTGQRVKNEPYEGHEWHDQKEFEAKRTPEVQELEISGNLWVYSG